VLCQIGNCETFVHHAKPWLTDAGRYEQVLATRSNVFPLTISTDDIRINALTLVDREITIQGLCASTMVQVGEMLQFAARHGIRPMIEKFPMTLEGINQAMEKLSAGELRYRAVLQA
jgi:D-arabinose 1-dehydrogenase-like Zn-dependent alcohol dehydrogenase